MNTLRFAVIGAGFWAPFQLAAWRELEGAECVAVCPTECLEMDGPLPWLPRPGDCISCELCVVVCPTGAVRLAPPAGA